jgi:hypothetical protein
MSQLHKNNLANTNVADPRWRDLYKIGWIISFVSVVIVILAIIAFFIWPYAPGSVSAEELFSFIQTNKFGALMALDFFLLIGILITLPLFLAIYVALKNINHAYALIALSLGLIAIVSIIPARPIIELFELSNLHATAATDAARDQYLTAGEALLVIFDGTAWAVCTVFNALSYLISSLLMLKSDHFSKATAYSGIIANTSALGFFIPGVGPILLFVATFGGLVYLAFLARDFFRLDRKAVPIK